MFGATVPEATIYKDSYLCGAKDHVCSSIDFMFRSDIDCILQPGLVYEAPQLQLGSSVNSFVRPHDITHSFRAGFRSAHPGGHKRFVPEILTLWTTGLG